MKHLELCQLLQGIWHHFFSLSMSWENLQRKKRELCIFSFIVVVVVKSAERMKHEVKEGVCFKYSASFDVIIGPGTLSTSYWCASPKCRHCVALEGDDDDDYHTRAQFELMPNAMNRVPATGISKRERKKERKKELCVCCNNKKKKREELVIIVHIHTRVSAVRIDSTQTTVVEQ